MQEKKFYFLTVSLFILFSIGYLFVAGLELYQLWFQNGIQAVFTSFSTDIFLALRLTIPSIFALLTLIFSLLSLMFFSPIAYASVLCFALMYLSREMLFLMQMYQGTLAEPFYNFNFLYFGLIMVIEMAALWLIPKFSQQ